MQLSWTLALSEKALQRKLNSRLALVQRPFLYFGLVVGLFIFLGILINSMINFRYENPDLHSADVFGVIAILIFSGFCILMLAVPRYSS